MARASLRGRKRLSLRLRALKPAVRVEVETAAKKNAEEVAALARQWVPVDLGDLRDSTKAEGLSEGPAIRWRVVSGDAVAFYARWVEFGRRASTKGESVTNKSGRTRQAGATLGAVAAQPYFFPAYRTLRARLKRRNAATLRKAKAKVFR